MGGRGKRRKSAQIAQDRAFIARLTLQGYSQLDIAEKTGLSQSTISRDLKAIHKLWLGSALVDFDEIKAAEIARINNLEARFWQCIERDLKPFKTAVKKVKGVLVAKDEADQLILTKAGVRKKKQGHKSIDYLVERHKKSVEHNVNPAYLRGVLACISERAKIYGLGERPDEDETDLSSFMEAIKGVAEDVWDSPPEE